MTINRLLIIERRPAPVSTLYLGLMLIIGLGWLPTLFGSRIGGASLDALFVLCSAMMLWRYGAKKNFLLPQQLFWAGYLASGWLLAVAMRGVNALDFGQAYKFVWYLTLLAPFAWANGSMRPVDFGRLLNLALFTFLAVYLVKRMLGIERPILMTENNFEIIFLALLYYSAHVAGYRVSMPQTIALLAVVVLSGSRSAAIAVALAVVMTFDFRTRNSAKLLGGLIAGAIGITLAFLVFESRSAGGVESIDRFRFFLLFLESIKSWTFWDYVLGADRLSPLPPYVCSQLSYYQSLFSYDGTGRCYSVIFHGFNLRVFFDHGILIMLLIGIYLLTIMHAATLTQRICVIGILLVTGLSVSALNNVYTAFGLALFCLAASSQTQERDENADF